MFSFLVRLALNTLAIILIASVVPGIHVDSWVSAVLAALVIGVVNALVRPILVILTLPVTILTLGLFLLVINAALFGLAAWLVPGFTVDGFVPALIGSVLFWLASLVIHSLFKHEHQHVQVPSKP